ncbi:hypothetical protein DFH09DRAFT_1089999 [Mycena vulgaris]|nr:hypothetical protein DFH09DRAFT_1089999 [Mycena vulgaris]
MFNHIGGLRAQHEHRTTGNARELKYPCPGEAPDWAQAEGIEEIYNAASTWESCRLDIGGDKTGVQNGGSFGMEFQFHRSTPDASPRTIGHHSPSAKFKPRARMGRSRAVKTGFNPGVLAARTSRHATPVSRAFIRDSTMRTNSLTACLAFHRFLRPGAPGGTGRTARGLSQRGGNPDGLARQRELREGCTSVRPDQSPNCKGQIQGERESSNIISLQENVILCPRPGASCGCGGGSGMGEGTTSSTDAFSFSSALLPLSPNPALACGAFPSEAADTEGGADPDVDADVLAAACTCAGQRSDSDVAYADSNADAGTARARRGAARVRIEIEVEIAPLRVRGGHGEGEGEGEGESVGWDETMVKGVRAATLTIFLFARGVSINCAYAQEEQHARLLRADDAGQPLAEAFQVLFRRVQGDERRRRIKEARGFVRDDLPSTQPPPISAIAICKEGALGRFDVARGCLWAAAAGGNTKEREGHGYMNCRTGGEKKEKKGEEVETGRKISGLGLAASSNRDRHRGLP